MGAHSESLRTVTSKDIFEDMISGDGVSLALSSPDCDPFVKDDLKTRVERGGDARK